MAYRLGIDMWHVVNPEDQKIHRLSRGDEVPDWALDNEGIDLEALKDSRHPIFVKDEDDAGPRNAAADVSAAATPPSPRGK